MLRSWGRQGLFCLETAPHRSQPGSWGAASSSQPAPGQPVLRAPPCADALPSAKVTVGLGGAADGAWPRWQMGCEWPSLPVLTSQIDAGTKSLRSPSAATPSPSCVRAWLLAHSGAARGCRQTRTAPHAHRKVHKGLESSKTVYRCLGATRACSGACVCNSENPGSRHTNGASQPEPGTALLWRGGQIPAQAGREGALRTPVQDQEAVAPPRTPVKGAGAVHVPGHAAPQRLQAETLIFNARCKRELP